MATSEQKVLTGTVLKFNGEAGADVAFSMEGVTDGAGRISAQYDQGASPRRFGWIWSCKLQLQATPTQYGSIDLYRASAPDGTSTQIDGQPGATDAALGDVDQLINMHPIGSIKVEEADTTVMTGSGSFICLPRYLSIAGLNDSGATINATDSNFVLYLYQYVIQGQAS